MRKETGCYVHRRVHHCTYLASALQYSLALDFLQRCGSVVQSWSIFCHFSFAEWLAPGTSLGE